MYKRQVYKSIPFTIPSLVAPSLTCICISCLGDEADNDSSLENIIIAGFLVFHVTNAGYISETDVCFAPKPPPIPVSYTHLDVYKRQGVSAASATLKP